MPANRELQRKGVVANSSNSAADEVAEGMRSLKIESNDDNGGTDDQFGTLPDRPGEPDCIYYLRTGTCGYGSNCRFNHPSNGGGQVHHNKKTSDLPERVGEPNCGYYLKTGTCRYGSTCKYHHPKNRVADHQPNESKADSLVLLNVLGLPLRQDAKPCPYYLRTGSCRYGYACKFHHPQPSPPATFLSMASPVYGSSGASLVPSPQPALSSGVHSALSSLAATYITSALHLPQSYMPMYPSSSQYWNTYVGSVSPLGVTSVFTTPASNGQLSASQLPERPNQPECRYYMNHGSCKYGSDCKYHHPKDISLLPASSIGPLGLPLRSGTPICASYSLYRFCPYGSTCKFDHPIDGYSNAYSVPPFPTYPPSTFYPTISSLVPSSDTPCSKPTDWIKKGANNDVNYQNQHSSTNSIVDSTDVTDSRPCSSEPSTGRQRDETD